MKQNAGVIAILMVFLAFFGITNVPRSSTAGDATVAQEQKHRIHFRRVELPFRSLACFGRHLPGGIRYDLGLRRDTS
jgi:hypothetical protein